MSRPSVILEILRSNSISNLNVKLDDIKKYEESDEDDFDNFKLDEESNEKNVNLKNSNKVVIKTPFNSPIIVGQK